MNRKEMIQQMLVETPTDAFLLYALALEEFKLGEENIAVKRLQALIDAQPDYLGGYYQLGTWYIQKNEAPKAILVFKQGVAKATEQSDMKALRELKEALMGLVDDEDE